MHIGIVKWKATCPIIHGRLAFFVCAMLSAAHVSESTATDFITESLTVEASKKHRTKRMYFTDI